MTGLVLSISMGYFLKVNDEDPVALVIPGEEVPCFSESRRIGGRTITEARAISIEREFGQPKRLLKVREILLSQSKAFTGELKVTLKNDGVLVFDFSTELDGVPRDLSFEDLKVPMRLGKLSRGQSAFGQHFN